MSALGSLQFVGILPQPDGLLLNAKRQTQGCCHRRILPIRRESRRGEIGKMSVHRFRFRTRWLGYDRTEVNRFLDQVAADRQFLKDKLNYLESFIAKQSGRPPDGIRAVHPGDGDETSAKAALDAERLQFDHLKDL